MLCPTMRGSHGVAVIQDPGGTLPVAHSLPCYLLVVKTRHDHHFKPGYWNALRNPTS